MESGDAGGGNFLNFVLPGGENSPVLRTSNREISRNVGASGWRANCLSKTVWLGFTRLPLAFAAIPALSLPASEAVKPIFYRRF
jgi:hypothetical protein